MLDAFKEMEEGEKVHFGLISKAVITSLCEIMMDNMPELWSICQVRVTNVLNKFNEVYSMR
jgi:hypothetical protein